MLKSNIYKNSILTVFFILLPVVLFSQTKTVNYSIPEWNTNGSFTFSIGSAMNPESVQNEGKITLLDGDGKIIFVITPAIIKQIQDNISKSNLSGEIKNNDYYKQNEYKDALRILEELYIKLKDMKEIAKLQSIFNNMSPETLNWNYVLSTIRDQQIGVTGTIE